ncbi:MAG: calcium/sodium antiporter [Spirochaetales bacterium]|nr:calcium/sodium antiporter [Spirochaetales bacterium]
MTHSIWQYVADEELLAELIASFPTWSLLIIIAAGVFLLSKGADFMIDGVVDLAERTGMPKVVIGATIVSLGTTMPEAFVSVLAAFQGDPGLALGNGVGSIIADTGLIFGLTALISKVPLNRYILNRNGWWQVGSATLLAALSALLLLLPAERRFIGRPMGIGLLILLGVYMYMNFRWSKGHTEEEMDTNASDYESDAPSWLCWVMIVGGIIMVITGARLLIPAASELALRLGVPQDVIAATMVAFGTSLPELMTAITAVRKGHPEITVGNVVGADVLNCLFVIGAASVARPLSVPINFYLIHFPVMLLVLWSFRVFVGVNKGKTFPRWQGVWLLGLYLAYVIYQYTVLI